jgi:hypothetical protein
MADPRKEGMKDGAEMQDMKQWQARISCFLLGA